MGQAKWVPMLETKTLDRLKDGKKEESYWPVAVAQEKFHCIILKGGDRYPYFPRPLLSEFDFKVPVSIMPERGDDTVEETNAHAGARAGGIICQARSFTRSAKMILFRHKRILDMHSKRK